MRQIEYANTFRQDYKRTKATPKHRKEIDTLLEEVVGLLVKDAPLAVALRDHALVGNWVGYRECHIKPDLLLIYRKTDENTLRLARLGSHAELFR